jgi:heat shock protein HtpX
MIHPFPRYFFVLTWFLIGPAAPPPTVIAFFACAFILAIALRRSIRYSTIALLSILGVMLLDSVQLVFMSLHLELLEPHLLHDEVWNLFSTLFTLNLGLSIVGALAAVCAAAYIEFGRSRMSVAKAFPELRFLEAPKQIRNVVSNLAASAGIQPPEVSLIDSGTPSAFTIRSKRKYVVAVSVGLLESLSKEEVEACLAHEISHLKNKDFTWRFIATIAKVALFAKPLSYLIEPAVYRGREFLADRTAATLVGGPRTLISALSKLEESQSLNLSMSAGTVCMCNLNHSGGFFRIFDKHPDIQARIRALQEMCTF